MFPRLPLLIILSVAMTGIATAQEAPLPPGAAGFIVEAGEDVHIAVNGKDHGTERSFVFRNFPVGPTKRYEVKATHPDGFVETKIVKLWVGQRKKVQFAEHSAQKQSFAKPELIIQAGHEAANRFNPYKYFGGPAFAAVTNDERFMVTGAEHKVLLWDIAHQRVIRQYQTEFSQDESMRGVGFVGDDARVVVSTQRQIVIFDRATGAVVSRRAAHVDAVNNKQFQCSQSSGLVAYVTNARVHERERKNVAVCKFDDERPPHMIRARAEDGPLRRIHWNAQGTRLLVCWESRCSVYEVSTADDQRPRQLMTNALKADGACFDSTGNRILTHKTLAESQTMLSIHDGVSGRVISHRRIDGECAELFFCSGLNCWVLLFVQTRLGEHPTGSYEFLDHRTLEAIAPSMAVPRTAGACHMIFPQSSRVFDGINIMLLTGSREVREFPNSLRVGVKMDWLEDNSVCLDWNTTRLRDGRQTHDFRSSHPELKGMKYATGGGSVICADETAVFTIMSDGLQGYGNDQLDTAIVRYDANGTPQTFKRFTGRIMIDSVSRNGRHLVTKLIGQSFRYSVWDTLSWRSLYDLSLENLSAVDTICSDRKLLGVYELGSRYRIVNYETNQTLGEFQADGGSFSPDGTVIAMYHRRRLSSGKRCELFLWDLRSRKEAEVSYVCPAEVRYVRGVTWSDSQERLMVWSERIVGVFEIGNAKPIFEAAFDDEITTLTMSPDGRHIMTRADGEPIRIWSVDSGEELLQWVQFEDGESSHEWLVMTPEGLFDGSTNGRNRVAFRIGFGLNVVPVERFFGEFYYPGLMAAVLDGKRPKPQVSIGSSTPPEVKIVSPTIGGSTDQEFVEIEVDVSNTGGGVKGPWVKHNGARVIVGGESNRNTRGVRRTFSLDLVEGENVIEIHAASADGSWESEPAILKLQYDQPLDKPSLYVVAVGIDEYASADLSLDYAVKDAESVAGIFRDRGPELYDSVEVLAVENTAATRDGIYTALKTVSQQARVQDSVILFLAGQGALVGDQYYFLPQDFDSGGDDLNEAVRAGGMLAGDISQQLAMIPARKRLLLFDTCRTGPQASLVRTARNPFALRGAIERLARNDGTFTIAGIARTDAAQEVESLQQGVLTYSLLAGLRGVKSGPLKDQWVDPEEDQNDLAHVLPWFSFATGRMPILTEQFFGAEQEVQHSMSGTNFAVLPIPNDGAQPASPASLASIRRFTAPAETTETTGQGSGTLHVVAIGIDDYSEASLDLKYAAADASAVAQLFQERGGRLFANVRVTQLTDDQANREAIQQAIESVADEAGKDDTLLVYLAGHGSMVGQRYYFVPADFERVNSRLQDDLREQGLPADVLAESMATVPALKRLLILDTCASGGALEINRQGSNPLEFRGAIDALGQQQGVFTIAASAATGEAQEVDELGHGVLTYALLAALRAVDRGPLREDGLVLNSLDGTADVLSWFSYAAGKVPRLTKQYLGRAQEVRTSGQGASFPVLHQ